MKFFTILLALVVSYNSASSQFFVKPSKAILKWSLNETKAKWVELSPHESYQMRISFDGVELNYIGLKIGSHIQSFEFDSTWTKIEVALYDFNKDKRNEVIIAYGIPGDAELKVLVYKYNGSTFDEIGSFTGQYDIYIEDNEIFLPFGSQGLFDAYKYRNGKFIKSN